MPMPEQHTPLGGKVYVYKRPKSSLWQCSTYLAGKNRRVSTKGESLAKAKEIAEGWYLKLRRKLRSEEIKAEKSFHEVSAHYLHQYDIMTQSNATSAMWTASAGDRAFHLVPFFGNPGASPRSPQERSRNIEFTDPRKQSPTAASHRATAPSIRRWPRCARP